MVHMMWNHSRKVAYIRYLMQIRYGAYKFCSSPMVPNFRHRAKGHITHLGTASLTMKLPFKVGCVSKMCNSSVSLRGGLNNKTYNANNQYGNNVANSLLVRLTTMRQ